MNNKPLSALRIALNTLKRKPFRTVGLVAVVAVFSFTLFTGTILSQSLKNGMNNLSERLGADILAVPYGYEADIQSALLRGEPSTFYFDSSMTEKIGDVKGVSAVSPQLYIATLNSGCCAYPLQLIGFDPATDFVIQPWIAGQLSGSLPDGEIVVGSSINAEVGSKLKFFNQIYRVAARLEKTGMGFDTTVFMNLDTAKQAAESSERLAAHPAAENMNLISSVMVKIDSDYNVKDVANNILQAHALEGVDIVVSKNMISDISGNLNGLTSYIFILAGVLWFLAVVVLMLVFSISLNSRKREFSMFRVLGATKQRLAQLILIESSLITALGALIGLGLAALVLFPFNTCIQSQLKLPYLMPGYDVLLLTALVSFLIAFASGPLACAYGAVKLGKSEVYSTLKEGE